MDEGVFQVDSSFRVTYVNASGAALLKGSPGELVGRTVFEAVPGSWCPALGDRLKDALEGGTDVSFEIFCPEPAHVWLHCRCVPAGDGAVVTLQDITRWKREEERSRKLHRRMQLELDELGAIYGSAPIGLCVLDREMRFVRINDVLARINGRPASAPIGRTPREMSPAFTDEMERVISSVLSSGEPRLNVEFTGNTLPGQRVPISFLTHWLPIRGDGGDIIGVNVEVEDITERKGAEEAVKVSEASYRAIFDSANDAIFIQDAMTGTILDCNLKAVDMFAYTIPEMRGLKVEDISTNEPPYTQEVAEARMRAVMEGRDLHPFEWRARDKWGQPFWIEVSLKQTLINGQRRVIAIARDITGRRHLEEALVRSEAQFRLMAESMPHLVWTTGPDGAADYYNAHYKEYSGVDPFDPEAPNPMHPDDVTRTREAWERSVATGEPYRVEHRVRRADGVYRWHLSQGIPVRDASGSIVKWYGTATDIDDQKRAQEILRRANEDLEEKVGERTRELDRTNRTLEAQKETLQKIIDSIPVMIVFSDPSGEVRMFNREFERVTGWTVEDARHTDIIAHDFPDPDRHREFIEFIGGEEGGWRDFEPVTRSGRKVPSSWANIRLSDGSRVGIGIDISSRKKMEQDLTRLATAIEQAGEGIVVLDPGWVVEYVNPAFERISGYSRDELVGRKVDCVQGSFMDDAGREAFNRLLSRGEPWSSHQKRMRKNGERMEATVTVSPVQDEGGRVMNYVAVVRDVTQEERLRQQMTQSQKLEALGTLAGGIAHDLKNIFTPIVLNIEMALEDVGRSREARPMLEEALQAARMGADLTRQIVIFSRRTPQEMRPVKVLPVVQEALQILRSTLPPGVDLSLKAEARDAVVVADPTQLTQVVLNLGSNAGHAMKEGGGTLDVTVTSSDLDEHGAEAVSPRFPLGRYVCIVFRDTGIGMDEETLEHIFEPFYTTKAKGEGSGMGLAVVHGIVRDHKGAVTVKSRPGEGSVFRVLLPMAGG